MQCVQARRQAAVYRDLSLSERASLEEHLARCPDCARLLAEYIRQDALLGALPTLSHTAVSWERIRQQASFHARYPGWRWVWATVLFLLLIGLGSGVVMAAERALPGDTLYPLKRGMESVRLQWARDPIQRQRLESRWAERRRQEAQRLVDQGREALLEIEGSVQGINEDIWNLDGLAVRVSKAFPASAPPVGSLVRMKVAVRGGEIVALEIQAMESTPEATPCPLVTPGASPIGPSPSPGLLRPEHEAKPTMGPSKTPRREGTDEPPKRGTLLEEKSSPIAVPTPPVGHPSPPVGPPAGVPGGRGDGNGPRRGP